MLKFRRLGWLLLPLALGGCSRSLPPGTEQTYYYWKTSLELTRTDGRFFQGHQIQRLYVRFFDLDFDPQTRRFYERAPLRFKTGDYLPPRVVPVVYVTPDALTALERKKDDAVTAAFLLKRVRAIAEALGRADYPEIQIDGDWTPSTRDGYFTLLKAIKRGMGNGPALSATIRLHQVKYRGLTGVPPVDRGILMVYHTSAPQELNVKSSILDEGDARDYLRDVKDYPLPLDVALPLFRWGSHFNQLGRFLTVFRLKPGDPVIGRSFSHLGGTLYRAKGDVYLGGFRFMKDDYLKVETSDLRVARDLAGWILKQHPNSQQRVIWFDYSSKESDDAAN